MQRETKTGAKTVRKQNADRFLEQTVLWQVWEAIRRFCFGFVFLNGRGRSVVRGAKYEPTVKSEVSTQRVLETWE